jgi:hypothetical protein
MKKSLSMKLIKIMFSRVILLSLMSSVAQCANIQATHIKSVIFDFAVLLEISDWEMAKSIGLMKLGWTAVSNPGYLADLREHMFSALSTQGTQSGTILVGDPRDGVVLPLIMVEWLAGEKNTMMVEYAERAINKYKFENSNQKKLITQLMHVMFDPQLLAKNTYPAKHMTKLLKKIIKRHQASMYGLTNWDPSSFALLRHATHTREIFDKIPARNIMISGDMHKVLPHREAFEEFLAAYQLNPQECLIINASSAVIAQAREMGMHGIRVDLQSGSWHKDLEQALKRYHVI